MEKKVILQVIDEGDGLRFQCEGKRADIFDAIGSIIGGLHYQDVKNGTCVIESMADIRVRLMFAMRHSFDIAHNKLEREVKSKNDN